MAWTTPRTWQPEEFVDQGDLNEQLRDNLKALTEFTAYTPALASDDVQPVLGTGSVVTGRYLAAGKLVICMGHIKFGTSGVTVGTGNYRVSLPVQAAMANDPINGRVMCIDASVSATFHVGQMRLWYGGSAFWIQYSNAYPSGGNVAVTSTQPWAWAGSDSFSWSCIYEAA